jgi:hypothetical protein
VAPFTNSIAQWAVNCRIVYDKFHVLQHADKAIDEVRRAEFFRKGGRMRGVVKGKRRLLLTRWMIGIAERGAIQASKSCFPLSVTTVRSSFFPGDCKSIPM